MPVHVVAIVVVAGLHIALQTSTDTFVNWRKAMDDPERAAFFSWTAQWAKNFPMMLTLLIDWSLIAGAAIIGVAHAVFYYRETQQRALLNAQLETRLVAAHLQTLQRQLHPHFLFNTLHAISSSCTATFRPRIGMLVRLGDLLRMTLDSVARPEIRLSEEMEFLSKYLQIEQVRLGDRLGVSFDVDNDVLDAVVPALILQPLVENAIKHGIAPDGRPGRIAIGGPERRRHARDDRRAIPAPARANARWRRSPPASASPTHAPGSRPDSARDSVSNSSGTAKVSPCS